LPTKEIIERLSCESEKNSRQFHQIERTYKFESCAILTEKVLKLKEKIEDSATENQSKEN
jgi:hypothetical protein